MFTDDILTTDDFQKRHTIPESALNDQVNAW